MLERPPSYINCKDFLFFVVFNFFSFVSSLMDEVVHTSPTLGSNVEEVLWKNIHFIMWDLGGQDSLRHGWKEYFTNTEVS